MDKGLVNVGRGIGGWNIDVKCAGYVKAYQLADS
jgi:hypothetical protein